MAGDYIPHKDTAFEAWCNNLVNYVLTRVLASPPIWAHIPKSEAEALSASYTTWHTACLAAQMPHTPVDTEAKNNAKKAAVKAVRLFVNRYLRYPPVTDEDRTAMGIPNCDTKKPPVPAPAAQAEADIVFPGIHFLELVNICKAVGVISDDPRSYHGVSVHFGILDAGNSEWRITAPPSGGKDLPHSVFTRKKKVRFDFDGESGKAVCLRYENQKGGKDGAGPFGPILKAIIP
jgi:hypothetical protein